METPSDMQPARLRLFVCVCAVVFLFFFQILWQSRATRYHGDTVCAEEGSPMHVTCDKKQAYVLQGGVGRGYGCSVF